MTENQINMMASIVGFLLIVPIFILRALVASELWSYFGEAMTGIEITTATAAGLLILKSAVSPPNHKTGRDPIETLGRMCGLAIGTLMLWGAGAVVAEML